MTVKKILKWKNDKARLDFIKKKTCKHPETLLLISMDIIPVTGESYAVQYDSWGWDVDLGEKTSYYLFLDEINEFFDVVEFP